MIITPGKYRTKSGEIVEIIENLQSDGGDYSVRGICGEGSAICWTAEGRYWADPSEVDSWDLVCRVEDEQTTQEPKQNLLGKYITRRGRVAIVDNVNDSLTYALSGNVEGESYSWTLQGFTVRDGVRDTDLLEKLPDEIGLDNETKQGKYSYEITPLDYKSNQRLLSFLNNATGEVGDNYGWTAEIEVRNG